MLPAGLLQPPKRRSTTTRSCGNSALVCWCSYLSPCSLQLTLAWRARPWVASPCQNSLLISWSFWDATRPIIINAGVAQRLDLFSSAAKHQWIASLEANDDFMVRGSRYKQRVNFVLREQLSSAALANIHPFGTGRD